MRNWKRISIDRARQSLGVVPVVLLCHCATQKTAELQVPSASPFLLTEGASTDLSKASVPILGSPSLHRRWGKPQIQILTDGSYRIYYSKPGNHFESLSIIGTTETFPPAGAQPPAYPESYPTPGKKGLMIQPEWQVPIIIESQSVRFAQASDLSGADPIEYSTEVFHLTGKDGRSGSYFITATSNQDIEDAASYIKTVTW